MPSQSRADGTAVDGEGYTVDATLRILVGVAWADLIVSWIIQAIPTIIAWAVALAAIVYFWNRRRK